MSEFASIREARTVVMCHGVFDVLHYGHLMLFEEARKHGDYLIISMVGDDFVRKGPGRPVFNERERVAMLSALRCVDMVVVTEAVEWWPRHLRDFTPHVYVRGREDRPLPEGLMLLSLGVKTVFVEKTDSSTTTIVDKVRRI